MARARRRFTTFNLSFLDIMSCGFGAVVLVFLIIDHAIEREADAINADLLSEVSLLEEDIREGQAGLVKLKNTLDTVSLDVVTAEGRADRIRKEIDEINALLAALDEDGASKESIIDTLKGELSQLESEVERLRATAEKNAGKSARDFVGDGNRQYLTGMNLGGRRILILLDASASMLDHRIVNIIRLRNMSEQVQAQAPKWRRATNTVRWLTAQLPPSSQYQVVYFNTEAKAALPETEGQWLDVSNRSQLEAVGDAVTKLLPSGGSSLHAAFDAMDKLPLRPDNIFIITDGLPTQGDKKPKATTISGADREKLFREAVKKLPKGVPINTILAPMEGDPMAAAYYWQLALGTQGSFISPSKDWP